MRIFKYIKHTFPSYTNNIIQSNLNTELSFNIEFIYCKSNSSNIYLYPL
jgi:hypothetical protein